MKPVAIRPLNSCNLSADCAFLKMLSSPFAIEAIMVTRTTVKFCPNGKTNPDAALDLCQVPELEEDARHLPKIGALSGLSRSLTPFQMLHFESQTNGHTMFA